MAHLLRLEGGKQAALARVHQAHQQVDLLVQHLLGVGGLAAADRAGAVGGVKAAFQVGLLVAF